jgi:hypothetical protein
VIPREGIESGQLLDHLLLPLGLSDPVIPREGIESTQR